MGDPEQAVSEVKMIGAFLRKGREERWEQVFARPKGRKKFLERLYHEQDISPECMSPIPHLERFAETVYQKLRSLGASDICHVFSASSRIDGKDLPLFKALQEVVDLTPGTIISCVPGKLAYYLSEERNGQYLLKASNQTPNR